MGGFRHWVSPFDRAPGLAARRSKDGPAMASIPGGEKDIFLSGRGEAREYSY
jgi:hypothetical protein